ncbi:MAG: peptidase M48, partial [Bacteroides heparinolyticus]|nr:peptidase M48 [Bacteroides heparinolyticus]
MKRFTILFLMACLFAATGVAKPKVKDISGSIAINGELKKNYRNTPAGTPVIIRRIIQNPKTFSLLYAIEINGIQETIPEEEIYIITLSTPQTDREFWQQAYFKNQLYKHFSERGYRYELRREIDEECSEYLDRLHEIAYQDDYITSYV